MKNLRLCATRQEVHQYVADLWRTESFRASHRTRGFIYDVIQKFAWMPRIFAETSNDQLERAHFSTWWNVFMHRTDYTNDTIHDLYWLHEFYHASSMPYIPGIGKQAFNEKMQRNELEASVLSEIQVYFEMPALREASFNHPIYADRFLGDPMMHALWRGNREVAVETIRARRRDVMVSKPFNEMDLTEQWIRRFAEQNDAYSIAWSDRYLEVEARMAVLQFESQSDRVGAARDYFDWITAEAARDPIDNIPFRQEAELFCPFYWSNKARYAQAVAQAA